MPQGALDRAGSADSSRLLTRPAFIVGAGRSGTTWLQLLLAQHPEISTAQETHLFNKYLGPLCRTWQSEREDPGPRQVGLPRTLSEDRFYEQCRQFASGVLAEIMDRKPGSRLVVEKTPAHVKEWRLIHRLFPDAFFIHMIRDPRAVVASMQSAGSSWGRRWAPTTAYGATSRWLAAVEAGREISSTARYMEVRYEELKKKGPSRLQEVLEWLGLPVERSFAAEAVRACSIENLRAGAEGVRTPWELHREPDDFYRKGKAQGWREDLSRGELRVVEYLAGPLMEELGYVPETARSSRPPGSILIRSVTAPLRERLASRLEAMARRLER